LENLIYFSGPTQRKFLPFTPFCFFYGPIDSSAKKRQNYNQKF
jgi:hypothetical protein